MSLIPYELTQSGLGVIDFDNQALYNPGVFAVFKHKSINMVVIRMARGGAKKRPFYRIVVADQRCPRDGRFIEKLGFFDPMAKQNGESLKLNMERAEYWLSQGAQPSSRVAAFVKLLRRQTAPAAVA